MDNEYTIRKQRQIKASENDYYNIVITKAGEIPALTTTIAVPEPIFKELIEEIYGEIFE